MRLYLDTNIITFLIKGQDDEIDKDTWALVTDSENLLYTSPVCVNELIHLLQTGKVSIGKEWKKDMGIVKRLADIGVEITAITTEHLNEVERLPIIERHNDPNDRLIIAQAISDRATLVSSDLKFPLYRKYGLSLHYNKHSVRQR